MSADIEERDLGIVPAEGTSPNGCQWVILETLPPLKRVVGAHSSSQIHQTGISVTVPEVTPFGTTGKASETYFARHIACRNF